MGEAEAVGGAVEREGRSRGSEGAEVVGRAMGRTVGGADPMGRAEVGGGAGTRRSF